MQVAGELSHRIRVPPGRRNIGVSIRADHHLGHPTVDDHDPELHLAMRTPGDHIPDRHVEIVPDGQANHPLGQLGQPVHGEKREPVGHQTTSDTRTRIRSNRSSSRLPAGGSPTSDRAST